MTRILKKFAKEKVSKNKKREREREGEVVGEKEKESRKNMNVNNVYQGQSEFFTLKPTARKLDP
jgi:hypothetical protein